MPERAFELEPYGVAFDCEECGQEVKRAANMPMRMSLPIQIAHECPNGHVVHLTENYPLIRYRYKGTAP